MIKKSAEDQKDEEKRDFELFSNEKRCEYFLGKSLSEKGGRFRGFNENLKMKE